MKTIRFAFVALTVVSCSIIAGDTPTETTDPATEVTSTTPADRECVQVTGGTAPIATGTVAGDALAMSGEIFRCANDVVVVGESDVSEVAAAAQLAAALGGPLLHPNDQLPAELGRLKPTRVHLIGDLEVVTPPDAIVLRHSIGSAIEETKLALGITDELRLPSTPDASTIVETVGAINARDRAVLPQTSPTSTSAPVVPVFEPIQILEGLAQPNEAQSIWLMDASSPVAILSASGTGRAVGAAVVAYDPADILGHPEVSTALAGRSPESIRYVGSVPQADPWEMAVLVRGQQVPGGGFSVYPEDQPRRYVAFYGHPETTGLGVLGHQGPEETLARMQPFLAEYGADGYQIIPTFEMIASVASAKATEDSDYSFEWPISTYDEWVRVAEENGMYIVLDLQPGREDFLTQAKQYEELLKLPFVGLALDPEWRIESDQVHLVQTGRVTAAEVNTVVDWLADLVRDNALPQKMLLIQQFLSRMIVDRETLKQRPELQMVIQMDGQGPIPTKDDTYAVLTEGTEQAHWRWGWKNFFEMDPVTATPAYTIAKQPVPVFVSYQ
ncbi:MAG TPA: hypothetical protein VI980_03805 [Acidimicrobiia bacterium]|nr:hypothetical protein [Acidimicrobiia bacterium]